MPGEMKFCDFDCEKVIAAFENAFTIKDKEVFTKAYGIFKDNYFNKIKPFVIAIDRQNVQLKSINRLFNVAEYWMGIDLPTLFSPGDIKWDNSYQKTIMILTEDPLRNQNDENLKPFKEKVILSTPFGLHLIHEPKHHIEKSFFWQFIKGAVENQHAIYFTDINKIWIKGTRKKEAFEPSFFDDVLLAEIDIIKPSSIIGFGKFAESAIKRIKQTKIDRIQDKIFPHPSGSNNKTWKQDYALNECSVNNKLEHVFKKMGWTWPYNSSEAHMLIR